jgi:hypothetical protein
VKKRTTALKPPFDSPLSTALYLYLIIYVLVPFMLLPSSQTRFIDAPLLGYFFLVVSVGFFPATFMARRPIASLRKLPILSIKNKPLLLLLLAALSDATILYSSGFSLPALLFRADNELTSAVAALYFPSLFLARPLLALITCWSLRHQEHSCRNKRMSPYISALLLINLFLFSFPLSTPRIVTLIVYIPVALTCVKRINSRQVFQFLLVSPYLGFIVEPLRHFKCTVDASVVSCATGNPLSLLSLDSFRHYLSAGTFDSFLNFAQAFQMNFQVRPWNALVVLLSAMAPRALIPDKPIDTGFILSTSIHLEATNSTNIGYSLFGEAFSSGGMAPSVVVLFLCASLFALIDGFVMSLWPSSSSSLKRYARDEACVYAMLVLSDLYILRGSLLSAFTAKLLLTISFLVARFFGLIGSDAPKQQATLLFSQIR